MTTYLPGTSARSYDDVKDLSPWSVEEYLDLSGWHREEFRADTFAVWSSPNGAADLLLPFDRTLRDFTRRFKETLDTLEAVIGLSGEALALEIVAARKDVFLLRADQQTTDSSIPFLEARRLVNGVEAILTSAAASTLRPRSSTAGRKPAIVTNFMRDDVRMGHTLHGSFVITVLAADAADEARRFARWRARNATESSGSQAVKENEPQREESFSFAREVMSTLAVGLSSARDLLDPAGSRISTDDAVAAGVTLQMLESVKAMSSSEGMRGLDMAFKWAKLEPIEPTIPSRIELTRGTADELTNDLIARFAKTPDLEQDHILGQVVRLERAEGSEDGQVVVDGSVGKQRRRVKVPLSGQAYQLAISAHENSQAVVVQGTFARKSRGWRMEPNASIRTVDLEPVAGAGGEGETTS